MDSEATRPTDKSGKSRFVVPLVGVGAQETGQWTSIHAHIHGQTYFKWSSPHSSLSHGQQSRPAGSLTQPHTRIPAREVRGCTIDSRLILSRSGLLVQTWDPLGGGLRRRRRDDDPLGQFPTTCTTGTTSPTTVVTNTGPAAAADRMVVLVVEAGARTLTSLPHYHFSHVLFFPLSPSTA
ncbi:unnamed protein product [Protopolystoma xenopodis]|uniref:Uncharacterized protein n=1 Tax=Protopolystoma xenopodis TaxID=117903 RepID=A0A3S5BEB3_9PLAT|nr:unnamed protein product [Protopolystoma xenopodis]